MTLACYGPRPDVEILASLKVALTEQTTGFAPLVGSRAQKDLKSRI